MPSFRELFRSPQKSSVGAWPPSAPPSAGSAAASRMKAAASCGAATGQCAWPGRGNDQLLSCLLHGQPAPTNECVHPSTCAPAHLHEHPGVHCSDVAGPRVEEEVGVDHTQRAAGGGSGPHWCQQRQLPNGEHSLHGGEGGQVGWGQWQGRVAS